MAITDVQRVEVAGAVGLPDHLAPRLTGGNFAQLVESAERLAEENGYVRRTGGYASFNGAMAGMCRDRARRLARLQRDEDR
jgi:hypothetical protein